MGRTRYISKTESTLFSSIDVWSWWKEGAKNGIVVWAGETVSSDYYGGRCGGGGTCRNRVEAESQGCVPAETEADLRLKNEGGR